jgi:hypothetical protein
MVCISVSRSLKPTPRETETLALRLVSNHVLVRLAEMPGYTCQHRQFQEWQDRRWPLQLPAIFSEVRLPRWGQCPAVAMPQQG